MAVWVEDQATLREFLSFVLLFAPDFPAEDNLPDEEQVTLERAFSEIRKGLSILPSMAVDERRRARSVAMIADAEDAFRRGDQRTGCDLVQGLQYDWFGGP